MTPQREFLKAAVRMYHINIFMAKCTLLITWHATEPQQLYELFSVLLSHIVFQCDCSHPGHISYTISLSQYSLTIRYARRLTAGWWNRNLHFELISKGNLWCPPVTAHFYTKILEESQQAFQSKTQSWPSSNSLWHAQRHRSTRVYNYYYLHARNS